MNETRQPDPGTHSWESERLADFLETVSQHQPVPPLDLDAIAQLAPGPSGEMPRESRN